jgi:hypothetical protein
MKTYTYTFENIYTLEKVMIQAASARDAYDELSLNEDIDEWVIVNMKQIGTI